MPPPRFPVAPNDVQNLFPHGQRVPLGAASHVPYGGTLGPGGAGQYWFYVPTREPGTLLITLEGGPAEIRLEKDNAELKRANGKSLAHELPLGSEGFFDLFVTPARPVRVRFVVRGWPMEKGGRPLIPWNFWYHPFNPTVGKEGRFDSAAVQRSAMEKFDRAFLPASMGATWDWEKKHHVQPQAAGWEGHCDMAAYASVYFEQPPEKFPVNGVVFTRDELELLATEWAGRRMPSRTGDYFLEVQGYSAVNGKHIVWFMKPSDEPSPDVVMQRYREAFPNASDAELASARRDAAALDPEKVRADFGDAARRFLEFLVKEVTILGQAVVGDFGPTKPEHKGIEVWNVALVYFAAEWMEAPLHRRDPRVCEVTIDVITNVDDYPANAPAPPAVAIDTPDGPVVQLEKHYGAFRYDLELRYGDDGSLQRARWLGASSRSAGGLVFAPHTLTNVLHPAAPSGAGNPFVGDDLLRSGALRLRTRFRRP